MRAAHLNPSPEGIRASTKGRAFPLSEPGQPVNATVQVAIDWLDVEKSARYLATETQTYCNILATDLCYLTGVFLPRVWWKYPLTVTPETQVKYDDTVREVNANALFDWLKQWGAEFGWKPVDSPEAAQQAADAGQVVVISAAQANPTRSGHISVVAPQSQSAQAQSKDGVYFPVQSQAGRKNYRCSCEPGRWWEGKSYRGFGIWSNTTQ